MEAEEIAQQFKYRLKGVDSPVSQDARLEDPYAPVSAVFGELEA